MICKNCRTEIIKCEASELCVYKKYKHINGKHVCIRNEYTVAECD